VHADEPWERAIVRNNQTTPKKLERPFDKDPQVAAERRNLLLVIHVSRGNSSGHRFRATSQEPSRASVAFVPSDYTSDEAQYMLTIFVEQNEDLPKNITARNISGPC
jgi:hypothetical protein